MPRAVTPSDESSKFQRYRANKRRQGMKLLRVWVLDPAAPDFAAEARRQAVLLRGAPEEREALDFIEAAADFEDWTP
ncbi:MAG TPA: antitoxin MazE family protein [Candidatus Competibacter sp.]|nr:antitoxin MazE family protein [Candidatus Competibacter sp.]